jgi:hypothetical protein
MHDSDKDAMFNKDLRVYSPVPPTDFRALCQELMDAIDSGIPVERIKQSPLAVRVDAALAQPEPQGPSELELEAIELKLWDKHRTKGCRGEEFMYDNDFSAALDEYRDLLARPEPQGPTDEELLELSAHHGVSYTMSSGEVVYPMQQGCDMRDDVLSFARAVLARWSRPAIEPVPGVEGEP